MSSSDTYDSDTATDERPSSRPSRTKIQANFQIAHPPPKSSLRLAPKLLLQIQQLAPNFRPVPVLEIWQPPFRKSKLTRDFVQRPKLRTGDIYATSNENYIINQSAMSKQSTKSEVGDANAPHKDIVAAMCQSSSSSSPCSDETPSTSSSTIHFRDARSSWRASKGAMKTDKACYRFTLRDEEGKSDSRMIFQCEKRESGKDAGTDEEEFMLFLIDRTARKKSRIATMSPGGLEILVRKSSILDSLDICMELTGQLAGSGNDGEEHYALETWLYTQVLTFGVWVAQQEGWNGLSQH
ncbi:hypothetical protein N7478_003516 [Penicillium angulare]|uniref:uncharacterized protein n=1 Tax=Penicillium angulare TaxID=116970 RepID=UPI002540D5F5|nr:uncharacterized protein N7478_003516 [Penicillium angulare]KAJ5287830.1 hypothetical protein N7478_003516 [Penicillium angulare]